MVKQTQTIRRLLPTTGLSVFDHFVGLAHKGLKIIIKISSLGGDISWCSVYLQKN